MGVGPVRTGDIADRSIWWKPDMQSLCAIESHSSAKASVMDLPRCEVLQLPAQASSQAIQDPFRIFFPVPG